jgi:two-component system OmpR family response regulator
VRALLRRSASKGATELRIGRLRLDTPGHRVWVDEQPLELTAREFGLLEALASRPDRITNRAQLVEALCNWEQELTDNGLDIAIHRLRRKLHGSGANVRTIRGLGYLLEESEDA